MTEKSAEYNFVSKQDNSTESSGTVRQLKLFLIAWAETQMLTGNTSPEEIAQALELAVKELRAKNKKVVNEM